MQTPHHRKIELQSPADLSYLYTNTLAASRQKLDLHFPPSANNDTNDPDPMKERVRELVDEFITKTFTTSIPSISINGLDDDNDNTSTTNPTSLLSATTTNETIEYEPYDAKLASRVSSLYAQLESLTTTVAQLRRDAPAKAARGYAEVLMGGLDDEEFDEEEGVDEEGGWGIEVPEMEGGASGEMEDVYEEAVRTLLRLQGEGGGGGGGKVGSEEGGEEDSSSSGGGATGLATTVGKIERAGRAAEVVEKI